MSGRTWRQRTVTPPPRLRSYARQWTSSTRRTGASACNPSARAQTRWHVAGFLSGELLRARARTHRRHHAHTHTRIHTEMLSGHLGKRQCTAKTPPPRAFFGPTASVRYRCSLLLLPPPLFRWVLKLGLTLAAASISRLEFSNPSPHSFPRALSLLRPSDVDPGEAGACMFLLTCRLNHSCKPNVRWTYDREKERIYTRYIRLPAVPHT